MEIHVEKQEKNYQLRVSIKESGNEVGWGFLVVVFNDRHKEPYGIMENVYIDSAYRSKGYGKKIVEKIIDLAKEKECYKLLCQSRYEKERVHQFYVKYGFKDHGKNFRMDLIDSQINQVD
ncbi:MAG: GNAT family N-acetyltransferase [Candidatus Magasanikbacteria bacterium]|jgi:GNAT superfamily N-acetyltransferase|nr:GNAT family N-acetyltransferase [Candidatus Magasanikbacteria bacterium]MBT4071190.1 GNAT family N-acetyltransferase [Candidatus Magasanikbacteria bacterium]